VIAPAVILRYSEGSSWNLEAHATSARAFTLEARSFGVPQNDIQRILKNSSESAFIAKHFGGRIRTIIAAMSGSENPHPLPAVVPVFPLPNVVMFPRGVLPLHIFEERYKKMTADVLQAHGQIAMALLAPGWEKDYHGRPALHPVVCVSTIISHERLADGRYNFLLEGHTRARIVGEQKTEPYRLAEIEPLEEVGGEEANLSDLRGRLVGMFQRGAYAALPAGRQIRELLVREAPTPTVVDLICFNILAEHPIELRQELLAEPDVRKRVARVVQTLAALSPAWMNVPPDARMN